MKKFKILLQDCRFDFEQKTIDYVVALKKQGYSIGLIAEKSNLKVIDVAIIILDYMNESGELD